jgi:glutamate synthase (ferredoxin)
MERYLASHLNSAHGALRPSCEVSASLPASLPASLIDERFDHDSCGVGFVASVDAVATHTILEQALTALARLAHRGATAADGKSSDGVGVLTAIPRALLVRSEGLTIKPEQALGVGMVLIPSEETRAETVLERCLLSHDFKLLCWRDVPVRTELLGEMGHHAEDATGAGGGCGRGRAGDDGAPSVSGSEAV